MAKKHDRLAEISRLTSSYYENAIDDAELIRCLVDAEAEVTRLTQENAQLIKERDDYQQIAQQYDAILERTH